MLLQKSFFSILLLLSVLTISGCWNYKDVDQMSIVAGAAIDMNKDGRYIVTAEIMEPQSAGTGTTIQSKIIGSEGFTIFDAVRNIIMRAGKKLYWAHAKIIILSEDIAKKGIVPVLDWVNRDTEMREEMFLLISRDKNARDIFTAKPNTSDIISFQIAELLGQKNQIPKFAPIELWDLLGLLASKGTSTVVPTVKTVKYRKDEKIPQVYGCAVFKKDKMVGWLDGNGVRNLLFLQGNVSNGLIPYEEKYKGKKTKITFEMFSIKTVLKPSAGKNTLQINIKSKIDASLAELGSTANFITDEKARKKLEHDAAKFLSRQMQSAIRKVQTDYKADIFGFGSTIKRQMPDKWKKLEPKWDKEFSKLKTKVNVQIKISESASTSKPIKVGD